MGRRGREKEERKGFERQTREERRRVEKVGEKTRGGEKEERIK